MTYIDAVILGIVEGVTEFLPISSTGHLILVSKLLGLAQTEFVKSFEIAIQLGAIVAVLVLYGRKFLESREVLLRVAAAFVPTAVIGFALYKVITTYLFRDTVVLWSLLFGGIVLVAFEKWHGVRADARGELSEMSYRQAVLVGVAQSLAVIPGVSRAAATILGGLMLGMSRKAIVEFSFLLAVPTMAAATGLDLLKTGVHFSSHEFALLGIGFAVSCVVAMAVIRGLLKFVESRDFSVFGWYRIALALLWLLW